MSKLDLSAITAGLALDADGLWHAAQCEAISYPEEGNAACLAVEDSSFWFRHRNRCIEAAVATALAPRQGFFLDVGAGNGYVARGLNQSCGPGRNPIPLNHTVPRIYFRRVRFADLWELAESRRSAQRTLRI